MKKLILVCVLFFAFNSFASDNDGIVIEDDAVVENCFSIYLYVYNNAIASGSNEVDAGYLATAAMVTCAQQNY